MEKSIVTNKDCIFCKIIKGEVFAHKVFEDDDFLAFLDKNPDNSGHTLIVPKKHFSNIYDITDDVMGRFGLVLRDTALAIKTGLLADGINFIMNNEPTAGQMVHHAHIHIIPRFSGDGLAYSQQGKGYTEGEEESLVRKISSSYKIT